VYRRDLFNLADEHSLIQVYFSPSVSVPFLMENGKLKIENAERGTQILKIVRIFMM
jgi:hypothetical protein